MIRASLVAAFLLIAAPALADDTAEPQVTPAYLLSEAPDDKAFGSADAPHTLILYASTTCPHCGDWFNNEWPTVKAELIETGKLRLVFRPMPTAPIQLSLTGFLMAECAPAKDYMTVLEDQFTRQETILTAQDGAVVKAEYDAIAAGAGLMDDVAIAECLNNQSYMETLQTASSRASAANIRGVPSFIFDGEIMGGAHDAAAIAQWVEAN